MSNLEGQKAPAFSLAGSDGKKHSLADYAGKNVVLYFYPKDDTPGCTKEACGFRDSIETQPSQCRGLGVSRDNIDSHNQFISNSTCPYTSVRPASRGHESLRRLGSAAKCPGRNCRRPNSIHSVNRT
jgi:peroxiredoxin